MGIAVIKFNGGSGSEVSAPGGIDTMQVNEHLIWEAVTAEQANKRQGTHKAKEKGEVRGGGAKPFKQKGTGRARQGSSRSPILTGGGTIFGPRPRSYRKTISVKKKRAAYKNIIAAKAQANRLAIIEGWSQSEPKTKTAFEGFAKAMESLPFYSEYSKDRKLLNSSNDKRRKITVVGSGNSQAEKQSIRNIPWIQYIDADRLSAVALFQNNALLFTKEAFDKIADRVK